MQFQVSSGWFDRTEPQRTTVMQWMHAYRVGLSEFRVVRPHQTSVMKWEGGQQGRYQSV